MLNLPAQLGRIVGETGFSIDPADLVHYGLDWTRFFSPSPSAVAFPRSANEVVQLVQFARKHKLGLVPSGGRTGLSGGACALNGEIVVSFEKMNRVLEFSEADASVTVEAGVVTAALQAYASERGYYYPVDFASSGTSQVGGNIATNAGGIRVLRYGMTRNWVSGLKVVTGAGEVLQLNRGLIKNNTGYDLRHLFIGSEGTLGFIIEATMQLAPVPGPSTVMLLAVPRMEDTISILNAFRSCLVLNGFEFFSARALRAVMDETGLAPPFESSADYFVLLEYECESEASEETATTVFEQCVAKSWAADGVVSQSEQQAAKLWQYRERISESISPRTPYKNDIAVRVSQVPVMLSSVNRLVEDEYPDFEIVWFGHIGDGNLHLSILKPDSWAVSRFKAACDVVSEKVLGLVGEMGGSVSAEHGIGLLKADQLRFSRSEVEISSMRDIKEVFDPDGVMNPGKMLRL